MTELLTLLIVATGMTAAVMALLRLVRLRTHDAGVADVGWTADAGACALRFAALIDGPPARRFRDAPMVASWARRLVRGLDVA